MPKVLVVQECTTDDEETRTILDGAGFEYRLVSDRGSAMKVLDWYGPEVVLTDFQQADESHLELVEAIRIRHPLIPVVLITAYGHDDLATEALRRGASSYIPRRRLGQELVLTLNNLVALTLAQRRPPRMVGSWAWTESHFILSNNPADIPGLIAHLAENLKRLNFCDDNALIRVKVALSEALNNAMLHGNLEVSSNLRERDDDAYFRIAEERRSLPPYCDRRVTVVEREMPDEVVYVIRDEGPGFDPSLLPNPFEHENLEKASGRGVMLIRTFMDVVEYNARGNELTMTKRREG